MSVPTTFLLDGRVEARYVNNGVARRKIVGTDTTYVAEQVSCVSDFLKLVDLSKQIVLQT
jgi:hypothetical protein